MMMTIKSDRNVDADAVLFCTRIKRASAFFLSFFLSVSLSFSFLFFF